MPNTSAATPLLGVRADLPPAVQRSRDHNATSVMESLLSATLTSRAVFSRAASAVRSPGYAALFGQRTEDQARIAAYLIELLAPRIRAAGPLPRTLPTPAAPAPDVTWPGPNDPYVLLGDCMWTLDASILEFSRVYGIELPLAQRVRLTHHQHQMTWAREELCNLQSVCRTPRSWKGIRR